MKKLALLFISLALVSCATVDQTTQANKQPPKSKTLPDETMARIVPQPISKLDYDLLIAMSNTHASPDEMIAELEKEPVNYDLTPSQILALTKAGIDAKVLDYLHQRSRTALEKEVNTFYGDYHKQCNDRITLLRRELLHQSLVNDPFCRGRIPRIYPRRFNGGVILGYPW